MEEYTNDSELAHLMAEASRNHNGKAVLPDHLMTIHHAPQTADCELTRGLYEPKRIKTPDSESGHSWNPQREIARFRQPISLIALGYVIRHSFAN